MPKSFWTMSYPKNFLILSTSFSTGFKNFLRVQSENEVKFVKLLRTYIMRRGFSLN